MPYRRMLIVLLLLAASLSCGAAADDPYRVFLAEPAIAINESWVPGSLKISPDGIRFAYLVKDQNRKKVILDGQEHKAYEGISDLWFSPDSRRLAYIANQENKYFLVLDGVAGKPYEAIAADSFTFSPDGKHYAFIGKSGTKWLVVTEAGEGKAYDEVNPGLLKFSPDSQSLAYAARIGDKWFSVLNGQEGKTYDGIRALIFSPDSQRTAVLVRNGNVFAVVIDDEEGPAFPMIKAASLEFSPDSQQIAYIAEAQGQEFVVVNHQAGKAYDRIISEKISFSPDGSRIAFAAQFQGNQFIVADGSEGKAYLALMKSPPVFSPDGRRLAYAAASGSGWMVVVDGVEQPAYSGIGEGSIIFSAKGSRLAYTAKIRDGSWAVVVDGCPGRYYNAIGQNSLVFSPDEKNIVYFARQGNKWLVILDDKESRPFDGIITGGDGRIYFDDPAFFYYWALDGNQLLVIQERIASKSEFQDFNRQLINRLKSQPQSAVSVIPQKEYLFKFNPPDGVVFTEHTKITDLVEAEMMAQQPRNEEIKIRTEIHKKASGYEMKSEILSYRVNSQDDPEGGAALAVLEGVKFSSNLDPKGKLIGFTGLGDFDKRLKSLPPKHYKKHKDFFSEEMLEQRLRNNWKLTVENCIGKSFRLGDVWNSTAQIPLPTGETVNVGIKQNFKEEVALGNHQGVRIQSDIDFSSTDFKKFMTEMFKKGMPQLQSQPEIILSGVGETTVDPDTMLSYSSQMVLSLKVILDLPAVGKKTMIYKRIIEVDYGYQN